MGGVHHPSTTLTLTLTLAATLAFALVLYNRGVGQLGVLRQKSEYAFIAMEACCDLPLQHYAQETLGVTFHVTGFAAQMAGYSTTVCRAGGITFAIVSIN